jgi:hypothetical protein
MKHGHGNGWGIGSWCNPARRCRPNGSNATASPAVVMLERCRVMCRCTMLTVQFGRVSRPELRAIRNSYIGEGLQWQQQRQQQGKSELQGPVQTHNIQNIPPRPQEYT